MKYFTVETFAFLRDLAANNEKTWFQANRHRYEEHVLSPAMRFIMDFAPRLRRISGHFRADPRPIGGSLFRIHRDTRFAKDKSPYKTHVGIQFRHEAGKDVHAPGFYLHIEPDNVFAGAGLWHPEAGALRRIRAAIDEHPERWRKAIGDARFVKHFELAGDVLQRPPRGYDAEHPLVEDLKRKDYIAVCTLTQRAATSSDVVAKYAELCRASAPLVRFLCNALELPV